MTVAVLGEVTVGVAVPGCASAVASGVAGIGVALPDLQGRIDALAAQLVILPSLGPIDPLAQLAKAQQLVASLGLMIALGIPAPSISVQVAALSAQLVVLQGAMLSVNAQLSALVALQTPLAVAGVGVYAFDGPAEDLGAELDVAVGGGTDHCNALALVAFEPAAWAALSAVMKVS